MHLLVKMQALGASHWLACTIKSRGIRQFPSNRRQKLTTSLRQKQKFLEKAQAKPDPRTQAPALQKEIEALCVTKCKLVQPSTALCIGVQPMIKFQCGVSRGSQVPDVY